MTNEINIQIDATQINKMLLAHQSALMSFGREWAKAYPDQVKAGEDYLDRLAAEYDLPENTFLKVKAALRGEISPGE